MFFFIDFFKKLFTDPVFAATVCCAAALIGSTLLAFTVKPRNGSLSPLPTLTEEQRREIDGILWQDEK